MTGLSRAAASNSPIARLQHPPSAARPSPAARVRRRRARSARPRASASRSPRRRGGLQVVVAPASSARNSRISPIRSFGSAPRPRVTTARRGRRSRGCAAARPSRRRAAAARRSRRRRSSVSIASSSPAMRDGDARALGDHVAPLGAIGCAGRRAPASARRCTSTRRRAARAAGSSRSAAADTRSRRTKAADLVARLPRITAATLSPSVRAFEPARRRARARSASGRPICTCSATTEPARSAFGSRMIQGTRVTAS